MRAAYLAVASLPALLYPQARTIARELGPRIRLQGGAAALAFSLAKAKPRVAQAGSEQLAHRWVLRTLLSTHNDADLEQTVRKAIASQIPAEHLTAYVHWLAAYLELPPETRDA
jgi:hypothetical protein